MYMRYNEEEEEEEGRNGSTVYVCEMASSNEGLIISLRYLLEPY